MHLIAKMTKQDQSDATVLKNKVLDLCVAEKVSALIALSAVQCAAECLQAIVEHASDGDVATISRRKRSRKRS